MTTKHDQILAYIETLPVGEKISVRLIAKNLRVSEGTAYRAIKDAQNSGLVSTIQRVGTIRIERKMKESIETLSYGEIIKIIEGDILGGEKGLTNILNKFIIGAMTENAMIRYITPGSLMIVGNRESVQK
ncbi:DRTGG domain-containing protein, partial [Carnobacterium sp.]